MRLAAPPTAEFSRLRLLPSHALQLWRDQMVALLAGDQHGANGAVARAAMSLTQVPCTCDPATKRERGVRPRPTRA